MKNKSHRLFMMEIVLSVIILFVSFSLTNLIFIRSMMQHQKNEAMIKMSESMVMISENIQSKNTLKEYLSDYTLYFDANGNLVDSFSEYQLNIDLVNMNDYIVYRLSLVSSEKDKLLSWDVVKVVE